MKEAKAVHLLLVYSRIFYF